VVERLGSELHAFFSIDATRADDPADGSAGGTPGTRAAAAGDSDAGLPDAAHNGVARLDPRADVHPGGRVTLRADPARLYYFDFDTGHSLAWPGTQPGQPDDLRTGLRSEKVG
jgi:multiple sugar transport system ATP-binding protein